MLYSLAAKRVMLHASVLVMLMYYINEIRHEGTYIYYSKILYRRSRHKEKGHEYRPIFTAGNTLSKFIFCLHITFIDIF